MSKEHNFVAITNAILDGYALPWRGTHGVLHWARVWTNGLKVAEVNGADQEIVKLFALFHDSRRVNEYTDPDHGERGGDFARELRGTLVHLDDDRFELLYEACRLHTDGLTDGDPTEQACWDADRLDLGRVGMRPSPRRLCTDAASELIDWATPRAEAGVQVKEVLELWGLADLSEACFTGDPKVREMIDALKQEGESDADVIARIGGKL